MYFPSPEEIIEYNLLVLTLIEVKKKDKPNVLNRRAITETLELCREAPGDIYDKAVVLLKGIVQKHPFASGNRRTAFIVAKDFVTKNGGQFSLPDDPAFAKVLLGVRERYYNDAELKEWLSHGKIREFHR